MPGIAGIITDIAAEDAQAQLSSMIGCMLHEPFYSHGTYSIPELGCYLGWVVHKESFSDCNPIINQQKNLILIFSGENFTDKQPTPSDRSNGERHDRVDARYLMSLYEERGERFVRELNGWFAGALVDLRRKTILLFNDRFGLHRIYYTQARNSFAFCSEAKSLLAIRPETRRLDPAALGQFFAFGCVVGERTLFSDVHLLPGGSAWTLKSKSEIRKDRYFTPDELEHQTHLPEEAFYERLRSTVSAILPRYFRYGGRPAVSLTGGVDTRIIMAFANHASDSQLSYTFGGIYRDCFDVRIARKVAQTCGYHHEILGLGGDFFNNFAALAEKTVWITDGALDICGSHEVYLNRLARQIAPVRITGNYGSEVLRSASTFKPLGLSEKLFNPDFLPCIHEASESLAGIKNGNGVSFALFKEIPWHLYGSLASAQSQLTVRSPYTDNDLVSLVYQAPLPPRTSTLWRSLISDVSPLLASIPTDRSYGGTRASIRAIPSQLYNYLLFKAEWYYNAGMPHWLAKVDRRFASISSPPFFFVGSHKIENYRLWFRGQLFDYVQSLLRDQSAATRPYLNRQLSQQIATAHRDGTQNFAREINKLVTIELIQRLFVEGKNAKMAVRN